MEILLKIRNWKLFYLFIKMKCLMDKLRVKTHVESLNLIFMFRECCSILLYFIYNLNYLNLTLIDS